MVQKKEIAARLGQLDMLRQAVSTIDKELAYIDPMDKAGRQALRQSLKRTRQQVQLLEEALQVLTPEERIVAELMLICPQRGNVQRLCEILQVEQSSVYRRRDRVLKKAAIALFGETLQTVAERKKGSPTRGAGICEERAND